MNISNKLRRVKAQADNLFLRGERTDVFGDLRAAEEKAEQLRILCEAFRIAAEKTLHVHIAPEEKRLKRVCEGHGVDALKDALTQLSLSAGDHQPTEQSIPLFRELVELVLEGQHALALEVLQHDKRLEDDVLRPLTELLQRDFHNWSKQRKLLKQVGQELDAARTKYRNSSANLANTTITSSGTRVDILKEEMEEAETRLDIAKDNYACELFSLLSREREMCLIVEKFLEVRQDYFLVSQKLLGKVLPKMSQHLGNSCSGPVYGVRLDQHLAITQRRIALPIELCLRRMAEVALQEEGLLRVAGSASKVRRLRGAFDAGLVDASMLASDEYTREHDVHVLAGAFKQYLRELPEPLLTYTLHSEWLEAVRLTDRDERLRSLWTLVTRLPAANKDNLCFVMKFLSLVAANQTHNKMTPNNIAIVVAPNLIWSPEDNAGAALPQEELMSTLGRNMSMSGHYRLIVEHLVECCDYFFPENIDFGVLRDTDSAGNQSVDASGLAVSATLSRAGSSHRHHQRNHSADFKLECTSDNNCSGLDSPKQPMRRKHRAPQPPQPSKFGSVTATVQALDQEHSSSSSPEPVTKGTGPSPCPAPRSNVYPLLPSPAPGSKAASPNKGDTIGAPVPAARLQYASSMRTKRPSAEPPKPPVCSKGAAHDSASSPTQLLDFENREPALASTTSMAACDDDLATLNSRSPPPRPQPPRPSVPTSSAHIVVDPVTALQDSSSSEKPFLTNSPLLKSAESLSDSSCFLETNDIDQTNSKINMKSPIGFEHLEQNASDLSSEQQKTKASPSAPQNVMLQLEINLPSTGGSDVLYKNTNDTLCGDRICGDLNTNSAMSTESDAVESEKQMPPIPTTRIGREQLQQYPFDSAVMRLDRPALPEKPSSLPRQDKPPIAPRPSSNPALTARGISSGAAAGCDSEGNRLSCPIPVSWACVDSKAGANDTEHHHPVTPLPEEEVDELLATSARETQSSVEEHRWKASRNSTRSGNLTTSSNSESRELKQAVHTDKVTATKEKLLKKASVALAGDGERTVPVVVSKQENDLNDFGSVDKLDRHARGRSIHLLQDQLFKGTTFAKAKDGQIVFVKSAEHSENSLNKYVKQTADISSPELKPKNDQEPEDKTTRSCENLTIEQGINSRALNENNLFAKSDKIMSDEKSIDLSIEATDNDLTDDRSRIVKRLLTLNNNMKNAERSNTGDLKNADTKGCDNDGSNPGIRTKKSERKNHSVVEKLGCDVANESFDAPSLAPPPQFRDSLLKEETSSNAVERNMRKSSSSLKRNDEALRSLESGIAQFDNDKVKLIEGGGQQGDCTKDEPDTKSPAKTSMQPVRRAPNPPPQ